MRLDALLDAVRGGRSAALVLRGEAGIGKTALLDYAVAEAHGFQVARAIGVQSEMELAYAGLHQLCIPLLDALGRLPAPQREALETAFGAAAGETPDRFAVGLAALGLLSEVAETRPLVCVVDDSHWLDRASAEALAFIARRLEAESIAMLFATLEASDELDGLPELTVEGLGESDARALLAAAVGGPLDASVRDRIVAETGGNPLALLELPRAATPAELAGGFATPELSSRIEDSFARRLDALAPDARLLLLVAAAEPLGDGDLVRRAAAELSLDAADPASELAELGERVRFRHPLARSAVYRAADAADRRRVHLALAAATDANADPDRRAWHLARAAGGPDEDVAGELERSAGRAQARGGIVAAAAFLERAAALTVEPSRRATRLLAAAQATLLAGAPDDALVLLAGARAGPLTPLDDARAELLRGQIAFAHRRGRDAPPALLEAARRLESLDTRLARETYLDAIMAALYAGRLGSGVREVAQAGLAAPPADGPPRAADLLLDGYSRLIVDGYAAGAPTLARAVREFRAGAFTRDEELRWLRLAVHAAMVLWDYDSWDTLTARQIRLAREGGALALLPLALSARVGVHLNAGELAEAGALLAEVATISEATASPPTPYGRLALTALQARETAAAALFATTRDDVQERGEGMALTFVEWVTAVLGNGLGNYRDALDSAVRADQHADELWSTLWLHELIEAAVRAGDAARGVEALEELSAMARVSGSDWALGLAARSRALVGGDEADYVEAIERLGRTRLRAQLARAHLIYGEWLRRERRRVDAREQLRIAHRQLSDMGVDGFAERARRELRATGETARRGRAPTEGRLTAHEAQIARLASDGLSNAEIGARLFISPRTVQHHLRKVFSQLGIDSRDQLPGVLAEEAGRA